MSHRARPSGFSIALVSLGLTLATPIVAARVLAGARTQQSSGVYSASQAKRGKVRYDAACSSCHMSDLSGNVSGDAGAPPLKGEPFIAFLEGRNADSLFRYVKTTMPADDPATLSDAAYLDILAYLLQTNGLPEGTEDLTASSFERLQLQRKN